MTKRLFIAAPLSKESKEQVSEWALQEEKSLEGWARVPEENFHLTFHFLGPVEGSLLPKLKENLRRVRFSTFELELFRVLLFPFPHRATVVTLAGSEGTSPVSNLNAVLGNAIAPLGFKPERRIFIPHVTVFRSRTPQEVKRDWSSVPKIRWVLSEFRLFQSELTPQGARYFPLGLQE